MIMDLSLWVLTMYILLLAVSTTMAHISLTYPPAREPPLDYLKVSRTPVPCGVPQELNAEYTTFYTHTPYNITFRMAYPHQGGYRLSLWNSNGSFVRGIWPENIEDGFAGLSDQTVQRSDNVVFLEPCQSCILLTERQGMELNDVFQSCADVNIVDGQPQSSRERCSGAGEFVDGLCRCDHLRSGSICQFKDADSGAYLYENCVDVNYKECTVYCFSAIYDKLPIDYCTDNDDCLNGGQCVEEVHSLIRKTCFCAFGYFGINCQLSAAPHIVPGEALGDCFNRDYPKNEWKFDSYGLFKNSCYEMEQLNKEDVVHYRTLEDEIEIILDYRSTTWVGIGWRPIDIDSSCRLFPWGPDSSSELNETAHILTIQRQLEIDNALVNLHPMNCLDIVIGSVHNGRSRIADHYTRDQSTPLLDAWYYGSESLTAAYGVERDGRTLIIFRRSIEASEKTDHSLGPGEKFVVWAKGQELGHYFHSPKSALEASEVEDPLFYRRNALMYHGKRNRGVHPMEFVKSNSASVIIGVSLTHLIIFSCATLLNRP